MLYSLVVDCNTFFNFLTKVISLEQYHCNLMLTAEKIFYYISSIILCSNYTNYAEGHFTKFNQFGIMKE